MSQTSGLVAYLFGDDSAEANAIRIEQILVLAKGAPTMAVGNIINAALTGAILYGEVDTRFLVVWMGLIWLAAGARLNSWWRNRHRPRPTRVSRRAVIRATLWSALAGLLWAVAALAVIGTASLTSEVLVIFVIGGQAIAAATWLAPLPVAFWSYGVLSIGPLIGALLLKGNSLHGVMGSMVALYSVVINHFARNAYTNFVTTIRGNLERQRLVAELEAAHAELENRVQQRTDELTKSNQQLNEEIRQRLRIEYDLRNSERKFRNVVEGSIQGIMVFRDEKILFCNQALCDIFSFSSVEEALALPTVDLLAAENERPRIQRYRAERLQGHAPPTTYQFEGLCRDGRHIWLRTSDSVIEWEGALAIQAALIDITESIVLENRLRHSQKIEAVGMLAGGVAHDFNNLLQAIMGYTDMALHTLSAHDPARNALNVVLEATHKGHRLTNQLLTFSRQEILESQVLNLATLVSNQLQMLRRLLGEHIELEFHVLGEPPWVIADAGLLEQMVLNLCLNARDAMPEGGRIDITLNRFIATEVYCQQHEEAKPGEYAVLLVRDTGRGMSAEVRERIFEPFFSTKGMGKGTGLGLSMVYGIVRQHNGLIEVDSQPDTGTSFRVLLPTTTPPATTTAGQETPAPSTTSIQQEKETILVAEDDAAIRRLLEIILEREGYKVITAEDGQEALEIFERESNNIDLLLLDMIMPRLSGKALYERLKTMAPHLPVIFSTGYTAQNIDVQYIIANRLRMIRKPCSRNDLLAMVREALDAPSH